MHAKTPRTTGKSYFAPDTRGFSLVELMVVIAIIFVLAAVAFPAYMNHVNRTRQANAVQTLLEIKTAQEMYYALNDTYATSIGVLPGFTTTGAYFYGPGNYYRFAVPSTSTASFRATAEGEMGGPSSVDWSDGWEITDSLTQPRTFRVSNEGFKFSVIKQLF